MDLGISGKNALVIGGTQGLGRAIAEGLASEGAKVTIIGRTETKLKKAAGEIGNDCQYIVGDLSHPATPRDIFKTLETRNSVPDILINNCGGPAPAMAKDVAIEDIRAQIQPMVLSIIELSQLAISYMKEKHWGRIVTITSSGVIAPLPNLVISNSLRSAVVAWNKTAASEVAGDGITMNIVVPGRIDTDRVKSLDQNASKNSGKTVEIIPVGRYGRPDEFAAPAVFLTSHLAAYITGTTIRIDGGMISSI